MHQYFLQFSGNDETKYYEQLEERMEEKHVEVDSSSQNTKHSNCTRFQLDDKVL